MFPRPIWGTCAKITGCIQGYLLQITLCSTDFFSSSFFKIKHWYIWFCWSQKTGLRLHSISSYHTWLNDILMCDMTCTMRFSAYSANNTAHQCHCKHRKCGLWYKVILIGALVHHLDIWPKQFRGKSPLPMRTKYVKYILLWQDRWMASLAFISAVLFRNPTAFITNVHYNCKCSQPLNML